MIVQLRTADTATVVMTEIGIEGGITVSTETRTGRSDTRHLLAEVADPTETGIAEAIGPRAMAVEAEVLFEVEVEAEAKVEAVEATMARGDHRAERS